MKFKFISFLFLLLPSLVVAQEFSRRPSWRQEFSGWGTKELVGWDFFLGIASPREQEYYTDSIGNVFIKNGKLHIRATADPRRGMVCSSGRVSTINHKVFLYGKLEVRAKVPLGKGIFPAIWMLREDHPRTLPLGEIDIMEYIDCFNGKQYCTTTHIVEKESGKQEIRHTHSQMVDADMNKYHVYTLEWTSSLLRYKLDGKEVYHVSKDEAEFWPFDDPYILIINVAYGSWGAQCGKDDTIFPREMLIDWIRYYPMIQE